MHKGFIALLTVLTLLAFSLSLTATTTYLSIGEAQSAYAIVQGARALSLTEGCAEDALLLSSRDENYEGGNYEYLGGTCTAEVTKDGTLWQLTITGTKDSFERSIAIAIDRVPPVTLVSWLEQ